MLIDNGWTAEDAKREREAFYTTAFSTRSLLWDSNSVAVPRLGVRISDDKCKSALRESAFRYQQGGGCRRLLPRSRARKRFAR
jgi:hypothetical protein